MNKQEVFDKVAKHLLTQGEQAMVDNMCKYRTEDGRMCAVGCLIADDYYNEELEGISLWDGDCMNEDSVASLHEALENSIGDIDRETYGLLRDLQALHDARETPPSAWPHKLVELAAMYKLDAVVVQCLSI
jgi:hypothetical protein